MYIYFKVHSPFPCQPHGPRIQCKLHNDSIIIVPSILNNTTCTAIFDLETRTWSKLKTDLRNAPYQGTLDIWHGYEDETRLIYYGGFANKNMTRDEGKFVANTRQEGKFVYDVRKIDDKIWMFNGVENGWKKLGVKLPPYTQNAIKFLTVNPNFCK